jgi:hypothetical protein
MTRIASGLRPPQLCSTTAPHLSSASIVATATGTEDLPHGGRIGNQEAGHIPGLPAASALTSLLGAKFARGAPPSWTAAALDPITRGPGPSTHSLADSTDN